jgi:hypothetical protein
MNSIIKEFANRPETAVLISPDKFPNNIGEVFYDEKNSPKKQDIMILEEEDENDSMEEPDT